MLRWALNQPSSDFEDDDREWKFPAEVTFSCGSAHPSYHFVRNDLVNRYPDTKFDEVGEVEEVNHVGYLKSTHKVSVQSPTKTVQEPAPKKRKRMQPVKKDCEYWSVASSTARRTTTTSSNNDTAAAAPQRTPLWQLPTTPPVQIVNEQDSYRRFISVKNRVTTHPTNPNETIEWDVVAHPRASPAFAAVMPFDSKTKTVTIIREYAQGPHKMLFNFPSGAYDRKKHSSILECAKAELSEEAQLKNGRWISLIDKNDEGLHELKWVGNQYVPFLVIDPVVDAKPGAKDPEEMIEVFSGVSIPELKELVLRGLFMLPSLQTLLLGLEYLNIPF